MNYADKKKIFCTRQFYYLTIITVLIIQTCVLIWTLYIHNTKGDISAHLNDSVYQLPQRMSLLEAQLAATNQILRDIRDDIRSNR